MPHRTESESRKLLGRLREVMAGASAGQARLDRIVKLIATASMETEVCSIYLFRDGETLELCATEGLKAEAVHVTRMRLGEGLVGRVARRGQPINTANAPQERGFRYMPETGEEIYSSFLGVPIQRLGEKLGVLVVQSREARDFSEDEVYGLEVVAMVLAEMAELGAFVGEGAALTARHTQPVMLRGTTGQEGDGGGACLAPRAAGRRHESHRRRSRGRDRAAAQGGGDAAADRRCHAVGTTDGDEGEQREVFETYRMFANSRSWMRRMEEDIARGLSAEAAVEKEQSQARARMEQVPDAYLRDRLHDLDDLSNRLLRILTGPGQVETGASLPADPILVARNIGRASFWNTGGGSRGIVLEQGSVGSHAAIVARAWAIPLVIHTERITAEALNGDHIMVDGDQGRVHLRPDDTVVNAFRTRWRCRPRRRSAYVSLRDLPAEARAGRRVACMMNAGLMADLPSLDGSGAEGVGLFRTELQFLVRNKVPRRGELAALYARVMEAAKGKRGGVPHARHRVRQGPALHEARGRAEPGAGLAGDPGGARQARRHADAAAGADPGRRGRPLTVMFPFVAEAEEFFDGAAASSRRNRARAADGPCFAVEGRDRGDARDAEPCLRAAAVLRAADFVSIGGNDLKQFFFAADRENERVRRRYDTLAVSYLSFIGQIVERCRETGTPLGLLRRGRRAAGRGGVPGRRGAPGRCRCGRPRSGR
jgi:phosphotransferase system, enzyme I, PtsP